MELTEKLKQELKVRFLEPKKNKLVSLLVDIIENKAPQLIAHPADLRVLTFEYDEPFSFTYGGYPDPNIIGQDHWLDQFVIDASEDDDEKKLNQILNDNGVVEKEYLTWIVSETGEEIEMWDIYGELEDLFFAECWQSAKKQTGSQYRCFFLQHEVYRGIDADTGKNADSDDIIDILTKEGFEFKLLE